MRMNEDIMDKIKVKQLKCHVDDRGWLMECMRPDWPEFKHFGQAYVTTVFPGVVKAWHYHNNQEDNIICLAGTLKLVVGDGDRFNTYYLSTNDPKMVTVPKQLWHGFMNVGEGTAMAINIPTNTFNYDKPDEIREKYNAFDYEWYDINR